GDVYPTLRRPEGRLRPGVQSPHALARGRAGGSAVPRYRGADRRLIDGKVRVPQPIADALRQEERDLYRSAFENNQDPAAQIYSYATMRGYRAPAPAPAAPAGAPGTPLGPSAAPPRAAAPAPGPSVTDVVPSIQRG